MEHQEKFNNIFYKFLINNKTMKIKTIEDLIKNRIEIYKEAMKKEEVKTDMYSQMYLRGAIEELKFIEQNIIQIKNK